MPCDGYAAAFFAAQRFFIAILSALRPAAVSPRFGLAALAAVFAGGAAFALDLCPPGLLSFPHTLPDCGAALPPRAFCRRLLGGCRAV
jgi:hypothetical protein